MKSGRRIGGLIHRAFIESGLRLGLRKPARFALYRILGNDLPPRHSAGQTLTNVRFILDHEPAFENCSKHWVLNRITDPDVEAALIALLTERGQDFFRIPFDLDAYAEQGWDVDAIADEDYLAALGEAEAENWRIDYRLRLAKNRYAMNNNGARNAAFDHGRARADYVLPFDGNIFLTVESFAALAAAVRSDPRLRYLIVPMARIADHPERLLVEGVPEDATEEPQVGLHRLVEGRFDERLGYGLRPKVDLMTRLGVDHPSVMGPIDRWDMQPLPPPVDRHRQIIVSRVARLPSGLPGLEVGGDARVDRWLARNAGIIGKLDGLDREVLARRIPSGPLVYDQAAIDQAASAAPGSPAAAIRAEVVAAAETAIQRGTMTVLDKSETAASGDRHDYLSRAPYFWPDPEKPDGKPYLRRDGERMSEATLGSRAIDAFDRGRLQAMFDGVIAAALAYRLTGDRVYSAFAADFLRRWFLDPATAMNPNFAFAQVRLGRQGDRGFGAGLVEMRDLPPLLDALRLLEPSGDLSAEDTAGLKAWLEAFALWMKTSVQGREARQARNNIGSYYDLEMLALALYIGDLDEVGRCFRRLAVRARSQFSNDGAQALELRRTQPQHYSVFNLLAWAEIATLVQRVGYGSSSVGKSLLARAGAMALETEAASEHEARTTAGSLAILDALCRNDRREPLGKPAALLPRSEDFIPFWPLLDARFLAGAVAPKAPAPSPADRDAPAA